MEWTTSEDHQPVFPPTSSISNRVVEVEVDLNSKRLSFGGAENVLRDFLRNPSRASSSAATHLRLLGVKETFVLEDPAEEDSPAAADHLTLAQLWKRFIVFWITKLESLEVDYVDNFLNPFCSNVNPLLGSPFLKRLHVHAIQQEVFPNLPGKKGRSFLELPQKIFHMEHLTIDCLQLSSKLKRDFFHCLSRSESLKSFDLKSVLLCDLDVLGKFINETQARSQELQVTLTMSQAEWTDVINAKSEYIEFASAVAMCKYPIWIRQFGGKEYGQLQTLILEVMFEELNRPAGGPWRDLAGKFCSRVQWIPTFYNSKEIDLELQAKFPNLVRLDCLRLHEKGEEIKFPKELKTLGVEKFESSVVRSLPSSLIHLDIGKYRCSVKELLGILAEVDRRCPLLKTLKVKWSDKTEETAEESEMNFDATNKSEMTVDRGVMLFPNLESLTFIVGEGNDVNEVRDILLKEFELPKMKLIFLELDFGVINYETTQVLDEDMIRKLIAGNVAKSLLHLVIGRDCFQDDALPAAIELKSVVAENARREIERIGSTRMVREWFDPASWNLDDEEDVTKIKCEGST